MASSVLGIDTAKGRIKIVVDPFCLTICLGMETGGKTNGYPQCLTEPLPDLRGELGTSVRGFVCGNAMEAEYMIN